MRRLADALPFDSCAICCCLRFICSHAHLSSEHLAECVDRMSGGLRLVKQEKVTAIAEMKKACIVRKPLQ